MNENEIKSLLNEMAALQARADMINLDFDTLRRKIIPAEIQAQLDDLEAERESALEIVVNRMDELQAKIEEAVTQFGASVKGTHLQAVFMGGRVKWDTKALDGYAAAHPEIAQFKSIGKPSVQLRHVNG